MLQLAGSVGLLFTIQEVGAASVHNTSGVQSKASIDAELTTLADSVQEALLQNGLDSGADDQLRTRIHQHVHSQINREHGQKTNLDKSNQLDLEQKAHKHHHHGHHRPAHSSLINTVNKETAENDKYAQSFDVPIDEVRAINLKVSPTWKLDQVQSVTLKSFRKVIGYDTFNSILKKDRHEAKDPADYYNITVSMMVKRVPDEKSKGPAKDPYDGKASLSQTLDKGFPYDDGDINLDERAPSRSAQNLGQVAVGKLNGENITKEALVNLVTDREGPITTNLVQLDVEDADDAILSTLFDHNVTRGALKNLVVDMPAPITNTALINTPIKLAQTNGPDDAILSTLFDHNVTRGALKNLVVDMPAPITNTALINTPIKLAQTQGPDDAILSTLFDHNVTRGALKNLVVDMPAPITNVALINTPIKLA